MSRRIRSIKPEILDDERTAALSHGAWRLFVSLWLLADDYGNFRAVPRQIGGAVFWGRDDSDAEAWLDELIASELIKTYMVKGQRYAHISGWHHQRVDKPGKPLCPGPELADGAEPLATDSRDSREALEKVPGIPAPDQDQDPDLEEDQDPDHAGRESRVARSARNFVQALADAGLAVDVSPTDRQRWWKLSEASPITDDELAYAVGRAKAKKPRKPGAFVCGVIEGQRQDMGNLPAAPARTKAPDEPKQASNQDWRAWAAIGKRHSVLGLTKCEIDPLREMAPTLEEIEHCCALADKRAGDGPCASFVQVVEILRELRTTEAVAC